MATDDFDDRDEYDDRPPARRRDPATLVRDAKARLAAPGLLLVLSAVVMLLLMLANVGVLASGTDTGLMAAEFVAEMQPPGPAKEQAQEQVKQMVGRDRTAEYVQAGVFAVVGTALDLVILVGGLRMRQARSYGLSMAAAICGIIPLNSCCCLGLPFGIWALVVLLNPDVKAGFAANKSAGGSPDVLDRGLEPGDDR